MFINIFTDFGNNRIQRFIIDGNETEVTVAGGNSAGICVTRDGQTLYVADNGNNRSMKLVIAASRGSFITSQFLNYPGGVALDPTETYIYVADYNNHRIQRFRLR